MAPAIIAAGISAAGSIAGGLLGGKNNKDAQQGANDINLQIARETNQQQYQMFGEQNAFNERMYNQMLAYNTPAEQMRRYSDAGINPYIAAGNVQTGNAQSSLQSAQAPTLHTAQMQAATGMGDAIQNAFTQAGNFIGQYAQNELALSQAKKNNAEAKFITDSSNLNLSKLSAETTLLHYNGNLANVDYQLKNSTLGNNVKLSDLSVANSELTNQRLELLNQSVKLDNALKDVNLGIQNKYAEDMFRAQLAKTLAETFAVNASVRQRDVQLAIDKQNANTNSANAATNRFNAATNRFNANTNASLSQAQIRSLVSNSIETTARTTGINIDNQTKFQMNSAVLKGLHLDNISKGNQNSAFWWQFGLNSAEQLSRIGVNGSQIYYNLGAGSEKFTKAASPGHYLLGW